MRNMAQKIKERDSTGACFYSRKTMVDRHKGKGSKIVVLVTFVLSKFKRPTRLISSFEAVLLCQQWKETSTQKSRKKRVVPDEKDTIPSFQSNRSNPLPRFQKIVPVIP